MMKKFLFSFLAVLVGACWFGGISSATEIDQVDLTASIPVSGNKVSDMQGWLSGEVTTYSIESVKYEEHDWDNWTELDNNYEFLSGHTYRVLFRLNVVNPDDSFASEYFDNVFVNAKYWRLLQYVPDTNYKKVDVYYEFMILDPTVIDAVGLTWFIYPTAWDILVYVSSFNKISGSVISDGYRWIGYYFYVKNWNDWTLMVNDDETFLAGDNYKVDFAIGVDDDFVFGNELTCTINGEDCIVYDSGDYKVLSKEFTVSLKTINELRFVWPTSYLSWEILWEKSFYLAEGIDDNLSWYMNDVYSFQIMSWDDYKDISMDSIAQVSKNYRLIVPLVIYDNFKLSENPVFIYNWLNWASSWSFVNSWDDTYLYINLWVVKAVNSNNNCVWGSSCGGWSSSSSQKASTPSAWWWSWSPISAANNNPNTEIKKVEQTGNVLIYSWTNELIPVDYLKEELEKNKELYKNAPIKVMVALLNLTRADIFRLKNTADAYKKAAPEVKQNVLAVLNWLANDNSKRAKYVSDYFKFIAGIE